MTSSRTCKLFTALICFGALLVTYYCLLAAANVEGTLQGGSIVQKNRARERDRHEIVELQLTKPFSKNVTTIPVIPGKFQDRAVASKLGPAISEVQLHPYQRDGHVFSVTPSSVRTLEGPKTQYNQTHVVRQVLVQESIQRTCQAMSLNSLSPISPWQLSYLLKHLVVDDRARLLYCYVPKVGCANWKRVFSILYGTYHSVEDISAVNHSSMKLLSSYSDDEVSYRLKNYFKFMFVRHPMDRLLSAYRNKFGEHFRNFELKYGVYIVQNFRPNPPVHTKGDDVSFSEFLAYVAGTENSLLNEHWSPYVDLCQPCYVNYDYVGYFESIEEDALFLLSTLKLDKLVHYPRKQRYYSILSEEERAAYFENVPPSVLQDVTNKFALDFQLFGYQPHFLGAPQSTMDDM